MDRKDIRLDRMSALDEALRAMVRTCPVPRRVRSIADSLAAPPGPDRSQRPHPEGR